MKKFAYQPQNLADLFAEMNAYLKSKDIETLYYRKPMHHIEDFDQLPCLNATLSQLGLTVKSLAIYSIWYTSVASSLSVPYIVIPFKSYDIMNLTIHDLKENANINYTQDTNHPYYMLSQTTLNERTKFEENTLYFVNADIVHSFQYDLLPPSRHTDFGEFLVISVNEDISNYFTE